MNFLAGVLAAVALSPFGLYHHLTAPDAKVSDAAPYRLVTIRGDGGSTAGGLGELLNQRGDTGVYLYRRGTAVSDDVAATLTRDHADYIAHDADGKPVTSNAGGTVIDITNPAVRDWLVTGIKNDAAAGRYDGVYLDVLGSFFSSRFYSARPMINGTPLADVAWRDASISLIGEVKLATALPVVANGFGIQNGKNYADHQADSDLLIAAADGIQIEQFVRNGNMALDRYKPEERWREDVALLSRIGAMGKTVLANTRVRTTSDRDAVLRQRDYALASFLLGAEGPARFRFAEGEATGAVDSDMAETIDALGPPLGVASADGDAVARRFEGGTVRVDPVTHRASIDVAGGPSSSSSPDDGDDDGGGVRYVAGGVALVALVVGLGFLAGRRKL